MASCCSLCASSTLSADFHAWVWTSMATRSSSFIELPHERLPAGKHGALVDGSLVRHLAGIERRRLVQHQRTLDSIGAAARLERLELFAKRAFLELVGGKDQGSELAPSLPGDDDVAHHRREVLDEARAQRANMHPRAGGELEVFRQPAAIHQPALRRFVVREYKSVAQPVVPVFVEGAGGKLRLAPVARRDVRALEPRLV